MPPNDKVEACISVSPAQPSHLILRQEAVTLAIVVFMNKAEKYSFPGLFERGNKKRKVSWPSSSEPVANRQMNGRWQVLILNMYGKAYPDSHLMEALEREGNGRIYTGRIVRESREFEYPRIEQSVAKSLICFNAVT